MSRNYNGRVLRTGSNLEAHEIALINNRYMIATKNLEMTHNRERNETDVNYCLVGNYVMMFVCTTA